MSNIHRTFSSFVVVTTLLAAGSAGASPAARSVKGQANAARDSVKESMLNAQVRYALLKNLKGADALRVKVEVQGTQVTLGGEVEDRASEKLAGEVARSVAGVTAVKNSITLNPRAPAAGQPGIQREGPDARDQRAATPAPGDW